MRPQPRFGTVEVRIMDAQATLADTAALAALVQCIVRSRTARARSCPRCAGGAGREPLAARDGMDAELIESDLGQRVPAQELLADPVVACRPHAQALDCEAELEDQADQGRRERRVLCTQATEDADMRRSDGR